ncbi:MAG TPA: hydantoinase/oxoprolinase family protein [Methanospirillum sp.]|nr:hydantoinase/oxoprolinase family protein [Methanospirillum sp.]
MFTGIDIGGTNTDIAIVDREIQTFKLPNTAGLPAALALAGTKGRLAVSTSQPLNSVVTSSEYKIRTITIPGPGLVHGGAIKGAVSHRGEVLEPVDKDEVRHLIRGFHADAVAIVGKFSVRNPELEEGVRKIAQEFFDDHQIAVSYPLGGLNFPARITTTQVNARIKGTVSSLARIIRQTHPDFLFVTSDGGLTSSERAIENPSLLFHSSPATVALGAQYLSGKKDCLVVDIGGTTTDLVPIKNGKPILDTLYLNGKKTLINTLSTITIPFGGDSCIREDCYKSQLCQFRSGNSRAFGGGEPTLTDALNILGAGIGDTIRSQTLEQNRAEFSVMTYLERVSEEIRRQNPSYIVGTGFLAEYLIPDLADASRVPWTIPEHAASANAVGAAVSRISIQVHVHSDSEKKIFTLNGKHYPHPGNLSDDKLITHAGILIREITRGQGAPEEDLHQIVTSRFTGFNVVRAGRTAGRIVDFVAGIAPGITAEAP